MCCSVCLREADDEPALLSSTTPSTHPAAAAASAAAGAGGGGTESEPVDWDEPSTSPTTLSFAQVVIPSRLLALGHSHVLLLSVISVRNTFTSLA